ncbi:hypothetical protein A0H81_08083 [Grifola frondosa]|uniref:Uncharacterized protein n=1 Tax=Grifola frondosa TaxID=5627 RepID=A0A1C7M639_GRIFR|nr:hypothetical protein A0H81_08083 [Grifola frondosa]
MLSAKPPPLSARAHHPLGRRRRGVIYARGWANAADLYALRDRFHRPLITQPICFRFHNEDNTHLVAIIPSPSIAVDNTHPVAIDTRLETRHLPNGKHMSPRLCPEEA